jgi:hypothetical protein
MSIKTAQAARKQVEVEKPEKMVAQVIKEGNAKAMQAKPPRKSSADRLAETAAKKLSAPPTPPISTQKVYTTYVVYYKCVSL